MNDKSGGERDWTIFFFSFFSFSTLPMSTQNLSSIEERRKCAKVKVTEHRLLMVEAF